MSFVDPVFAPFLLFVLAIFFTLNTLRSQLAWLLACSYLFYAWWSPRFLILLLLSSAVDYAVGLGFPRARSPAARKGLLLVSLTVNLGLLATFKYMGFFVDATAQGLEFFGWTWQAPEIDLILPLGISFYTFQTLSYTIDVYRRRIEPCRNPLQFFFFVAAYPQLVAGPIVRAGELLPQLDGDLRRRIRTGGVFLILYGLLKKVCLADPLGAFAVDPVFAYSERYSTWSHILAVYGFAFQIFLDFSAYSDIARGCGKLMGLELPVNFKSPYLARSPREYWSRWHITLSTWLRDYLYLPLGGNRKVYRNMMVTVLLGGLWHGAAWHFLVWAGLHGLLFIAYDLFPSPAPDPGRWRRFWGVLAFFHVTCFARVFFRADDLPSAFEFISDTFVAGSGEATVNRSCYLLLAAAILIHNYAEPRLDRWADLFNNRRPMLLALLAMAILTLCVIFRLHFQAYQAFIYFQF